ncbi:MAG: hypothetical protein ACRED9_07680 [Caulobacteraceae bacterium]
MNRFSLAATVIIALLLTSLALGERSRVTRVRRSRIFAFDSEAPWGEADYEGRGIAWGEEAGASRLEKADAYIAAAEAGAIAPPIAEEEDPDLGGRLETAEVHGLAKTPPPRPRRRRALGGRGKGR